MYLYVIKRVHLLILFLRFHIRIVSAVYSHGAILAKSCLTILAMVDEAADEETFTWVEFQVFGFKLDKK